MKFLLGMLASVALCGSAIAADMPYKAAPAATTALPAWTGLYGGIHGGYGMDTSGTVVTGATTLNGLSTDLGAAPRGPLLGAQLGYDWQPATDIVFGVRLDGSWANMTASGNMTSSGVNVLSINNATNWLGDADARLGYSGFGNHVLLYVDGGFAFGGHKPDLTALATPAVAASQTSTGWNAGGGIETRLTQHVSAFAEFDYYNLGNPSLSATIGGTTLVTASTPMTFAVGKLGINIR